MYFSEGKQYCGEKAIISLTSWKPRLGLAAQAIRRILDVCPGFHVVLVLAEEEFPGRKQTTSATLNNLVDNKRIELMWIDTNYKSFKKIVFTMDKYPFLPIISADDDCFYKYNYAEELYRKWLKHPANIVTCMSSSSNFINSPWGPFTLHPPKMYDTEKSVSIMKYCLSHDSSHDDIFYGFYSKMLYRSIISLNKQPDTVKTRIRGGSASSLSNYRKLHPVNHFNVLQSAFFQVFGVMIEKD